MPDAEFREEEAFAVGELSQGFGKSGSLQRFDRVHRGIPVADDDRELVVEIATRSNPGPRSMVILSGRQRSESFPLKGHIDIKLQHKIRTPPPDVPQPHASPSKRAHELNRR